MMIAPRFTGVGMVTEFRQLVVDVLVLRFPFFQERFDELLAVVFNGLFFGEEFIDVGLWHKPILLSRAADFKICPEARTSNRLIRSNSPFSPVAR